MMIAELNIQIVSAMPYATNQIIFDCPKCGNPYKITIYANFQMKAGNGIWQWQCSKGDYSDFTISPSINNHYHGNSSFPNKLKPCGWHGRIINGYVIQ